MNIRVLLIDRYEERRSAMARALLSNPHTEVFVLGKNRANVPYFSRYHLANDNLELITLEAGKAPLDHKVVFIHGRDADLRWKPSTETPCIWYGGVTGRDPDQLSSEYDYSIYRPITEDGEGVLTTTETAEILEFVKKGHPKDRTVAIPGTLRGSAVDSRYENMAGLLESLVTYAEADEEKKVDMLRSNILQRSRSLDLQIKKSSNSGKEPEEDNLNIEEFCNSIRKDRNSVTEIEFTRSLYTSISSVRNHYLKLIDSSQ